MVTSLISLLIVALVLATVIWIIKVLGLPNPMFQIVTVIAVLIFVIYALKAFGLVSL